MVSLVRKLVSQRLVLKSYLKFFRLVRQYIISMAPACTDSGLYSLEGHASSRLDSRMNKIIIILHFIIMITADSDRDSSGLR
jgi:hypothetical protein